MINQYTASADKKADTNFHGVVEAPLPAGVAAAAPVQAAKVLAASQSGGGGKCCFRWDGGAAPTTGYRVFAPDKSGACPSWWVPDFSEIRYEGSPCPKNEAEARALWYASPMSHAWMVAASKAKGSSNTAALASGAARGARRQHVLAGDATSIA